jgi:hypothetical protein
VLEWDLRVVPATLEDVFLSLTAESVLGNGVSDHLRSGVRAFDFDDAPELDLTLVAKKPSPVSQALNQQLEKVESFTVTKSKDAAAARRRLADGETDRSRGGRTRGGAHDH